MIKKIRKLIIGILPFTILFTWGCMQDIDTTKDVFEADGVTLNDNHIGWGHTTCDVCHQTHTLFTNDNATLRHSLIKTGDDNVIWDAAFCTACHGDNGANVDTSSLSDCTRCHNSTATFINANKRFNISHDLKDNLTSYTADKCRKCHNLTNHSKHATTLNELSVNNCLECHNEHEHGQGGECLSCHSLGGGTFKRDQDGHVTGHYVTFPKGINVNR